MPAAHERPDIAIPGDWQEHAACKHQTDTMTEVIDPRSEPSRPEQQRAAHARSICNRCPVLHDCRQWAMTDPDPAEWMHAGGLTYRERRAIRRQIRVA